MTEGALRTLGVQRSLPYSVPALPAVLQYFDEYSEQELTLKPHVAGDEWPILSEGRTSTIDFQTFADYEVRELAKLMACRCILMMTSSSALILVSGLRHVDDDSMKELVSAQPSQAPEIWERLRANDWPTNTYSALKCLLCVLCETRCGNWHPEYLRFLSANLPLPGQEKFASVKAGIEFLPIEAEGRIIRFLDDATLKRQRMSETALTDACLVLCSYVFGLRPTQIGRLRFRDVTVRTLTDGRDSVHLNFQMVKQRKGSPAKKIPLPRRIPEAWAALVAEHARRRVDAALDEHFFGITQSRMIGRRLVQVLSAVSDLDLNAGTLRHAGAQRLVDAGASKEELAAFMGHSDVNTGQVYFTTSANQAELLNRALGASPTYIALAQLATRRSITPQELADLKGDQQVAGVPHGIPITGIGGCQSGQAACPYNPIMACYGCDRFLPVRDISVHHGVLRDFRAIVKSFHDASRGDTRSPTFVQLTRAVRDVQNTIAELDAEVHND